MPELACPRCLSIRVYRETQRVPRCAYRDLADPGITQAGWYVCRGCWHKWDGITDSGDGVLPAGVVAQDCDATIALLSHQMRAVCERVGLGADHALHDYIPLLGHKIDLLRRNLHNEQVRRDEWEKMYNQAIAEPAPDTLPCGHPRSAIASDGDDALVHDVRRRRDDNYDEPATM